MAKILKVRNADNTAWVEIASSVPDTSEYATKTYADNAAATAAAAIVDSAPSTLNTLNELAAALNDDASFASTITTSLSNKLNVSDVPTTPVYMMNTGTDAQRPQSPTEGMFRFNTDSGEPEWYSETINDWVLFSAGIKDGSTQAKAATSGTSLYNLGLRTSGVYWLTAHGRRAPFQAYVALDDTWKGSVLVIKQAGQTLTSAASSIGNGDIKSLATSLGAQNAGEGTKFEDSIIQDLANATTATVGILSYRDADFTTTNASNNSTGSFRLTDGKCWFSWNFSTFNYANRMNPGTVYTTVDLANPYSIAGSGDASHTGWNTYVGDAAYSFITNHTSGYGFQNHTMGYSSDDACAIFVRSST